MMSFYARYVPQSSPSISEKHTQAGSSLKRSAQHYPERTGKRQKVELSTDGNGKLSTPGSAATTKSALRSDSNVLHKHHQGKALAQAPSEAENDNEEITKPAQKPKREKNKRAQAEDGHLAEQSQVHQKVLSKYSKHRQKQSESTETSIDTVAGVGQHEQLQQAQPEVHDLEPIPQPKAADAPKIVPRYSTLPSWLENPISVSSSATKPFSELPLHKTLQQNLNTQSLLHALPIQCAVLPLSLEKSLFDRPDLCVAAATGSGKTLAYALPILQSLIDHNSAKLRAVVVVPTRALVKQVVQTFESLLTKCHVKVIGAEGSRTLIEEQVQLVEEFSVYDPAEYERQRDAAIDWVNWSLERALEDASPEKSQKYGNVSAYASKCNILVTTPGRLVEHLQSTRGFSLADVQWFVADEADRLLNESYHEWLEVVLPALKDQAATAYRDDLFQKMQMDVPKRRVTKILLSATMTQDISQLLALELVDPKLVVVENETTKNKQEDMLDGHGASADYQLPPLLVEIAVPVKDSADKPLYLLEILTKQILTPNKPDGVQLKVTEKSTSSSKQKLNSAQDSDTSDSEISSDNDSDASSVSSTSSDVSSPPSLSSDLSSSSSDSDTTSSKASPGPRKSSSIPQSIVSDSSTPRILIFTSSTQSAHRLSRLLSLLEPRISSQLANFTRTSSATANPKKNSSKALLSTQKKILRDLITGKTTLVITTDLAARGLDIPNLTHVINYDIPTSPLTYVHRVGRTARAGRSGEAWTLIEHRQGKWFWDEIGGKKAKTIAQEQKIARASEIRKLNVRVDEGRREPYERALEQLGRDVKGQ